VEYLEPYYIIMRLPDEEREEFLLMLPFTPTNKNNTIGWLAARCKEVDALKATLDQLVELTTEQEK